MNTAIQENFPAVRRRSLTTLDGLLRNTVAESFLSYISGIKNHRKTLKESEEAISANFKKMNMIVSRVDEHIFRRLQNHEKELFSIVKSEIEVMKQETKEIVEKLNAAIAQRNNDDEIWSLSNELDYFKTQTLSIFTQNKKMKEEIATLRTSLREMNVEIANSDSLMQKLKKKYLRENYIKEKIIAYINQKIVNNAQHEITAQRMKEMTKVGKGEYKIRIKTQVEEKEGRKGMRGVTSTALDDYNPPEFEERSTDKYSFPHSFRFEKTMKLQTTEKGTQTDSFIQIEQQPYKVTTLRHFSNTSYVHIPADRDRRISILKNGFNLHRDTKKMDRTDLSIALPKEKSRQAKHARYMSLAFNKNKLSRQRTTHNQSSSQL